MFGYKWAKAARQSDIPDRSVNLIKECVIAVWDNNQCDNTSMEKLSNALGMLPNLKSACVCRRRESPRLSDGWLRCLRKLELVDGRFTTNRLIDVTSLQALGTLTNHE
ncbi:Efflux pump [Venturia inaequalis]|nr:Efflux pump [Venturia inaequalis]